MQMTFLEACLLALSLLAADVTLAWATRPSPAAALCRQDPKAASKFCALPYRLGNFQGAQLLVHSTCPFLLSDLVVSSCSPSTVPAC